MLGYLALNAASADASAVGGVAMDAPPVLKSL